MGILVIGLFLFFFLKIFDWGFIRSEITEYPVGCETPLVYGQCKGNSYPLNRTTYKVIPEKEEVLYWSEIGGGIQKLEGCAIKDRKNWSCHYGDNSAEFGFRDGNFWSLSNSLKLSKITELEEKMYYVSRFVWFKLKCAGVSPFLCPLIVVLD